MKLIFCPDCHDMVQLRFEVRNCWCGLTGGRYRKEDLHAEIWGHHVVPIGISNPHFDLALESRPQRGMGSEFLSFVIPFECESISQLDTPRNGGNLSTNKF